MEEKNYGITFTELKNKVDLLNIKKEVNFFEITSIEKRELSHSSFLAWLFNPKENHKLGIRFLSDFVDLINRKKNESLIGDPLLIDEQPEIVVKTENTRKNSRIDITIKINEQLVCIENKIRMPPNEEQLIREWKDFNPCFLVLLAPHYNLSSLRIKNKILKNELICIEYRDICECLKKLIKENYSTINNNYFIFSQFMKNIQENVMRPIEFNEKSLLFADYYNEINEIKRNFSKDRQNISNEFKSIVENHGYRFKSFRHNECLQIFKDEWNNRNFKVHIEIILTPADVKKKQIFYAVDIENKSHPKVKRLRDIFKKKAEKSLTKLGYKWANETYHVFKKNVKIGNKSENKYESYITALKGELELLIEEGIEDKVITSIEELNRNP